MDDIILIYWKCVDLKAEMYLKPKLSKFCAISQNYQHLLWKKIYKHPEANCLLKNGIGILVSQSDLQLLIKTVFCMLLSRTEELPGLVKYQCQLWLSQTICFKIIILLFKKSVNFEMQTCSILVRVQFQPKHCISQTMSKKEHVLMSPILTKMHHLDR